MSRSARKRADHAFASITQVVPESLTPVFAIVRDVSESGVGVTAMQPLKVPGTVRASISIGEDVFEMTLRVARCDSCDGRYSVGLRFPKNDPGRAAFLAAFLAHERQRAG